MASPAAPRAPGRACDRARPLRHATVEAPAPRSISRARGASATSGRARFRRRARRLAGRGPRAPRLHGQRDRAAPRRRRADLLSRGARGPRRARAARLHDRSFLDDPTRLLRLARYAARLGFEPDPVTDRLAAAAIAGGALGTVTGSRLGAELRLLLREPQPAALLALERHGLGRALLGDDVRGRRARSCGARWRWRRHARISRPSPTTFSDAARLDDLAFPAGDRDIVGAAVPVLRDDMTDVELWRAVRGRPGGRGGGGRARPYEAARRWLDDVRHRRLGDRRARPRRRRSERAGGRRSARAGDRGDARRPRARPRRTACRRPRRLASVPCCSSRPRSAGKAITSPPRSTAPCAVHDPARRRVGGPVRVTEPRPPDGRRFEHVDENRVRVASATGCPRERFLYGKQVHGATVRRATEPPGPQRPPRRRTARRPRSTGHPALVFVADCTPVLLVADAGVAALHCGWRGTAAGILAEASRRCSGRSHGAHRPGCARLLLRGRRGGPRGIRRLRRPPRRAQPRPARDRPRQARRAGRDRGP